MNVILTANCGSSSLKFALFTPASPPELLLSGHIRDIGRDSEVKIEDATGKALHQRTQPVENMEAAVRLLITLLSERFHQYTIGAIGHRMVQGGLRHFQPEKITTELVSSLETLIPLAPEHLPSELAAIRIFQQAFQGMVQVACFDTAFHRHMPFPARHYALPRRFWEDGVIRYGFHGLSYEYIMQQMRQIAPEQANGRIIIAHLGNGASMAAVHQGRSIDTTMGLTPAGGLVMSTRAGDLDPGVLLYLLQEKHMRPDQLNVLLNRQSGLKALSGNETDIQQLLQSTDTKAAEAIDMFCYHAKKFIGAMAAALGGLDTLVFTGGIGEHAPSVRKQICDGLQFLGICLDTAVNEEHAAVISENDSPVIVRVIAANEELVIAQHTQQWLEAHQNKVYG